MDENRLSSNPDLGMANSFETCPKPHCSWMRMDDSFAYIILETCFVKELETANPRPCANHSLPAGCSNPAKSKMIHTVP